MKKISVALAALMVCGVASANAGSAQGYTNDLSLNGISLRLGIAFPTDNRLSNFSSNLTGLGLEFETGSSLAKNGDSYLAIDYLTKSIGTFGKGSVIPVTYNVRFNNASEFGTRRTYTFVGGGLAFTDFTSSDTVLLVRGGLGIQLSDTNFFELTGTFSAKTGNDGSINTIGLYFGYRF